jgi:GTP cyclohydrolase II
MSITRIESIRQVAETQLPTQWGLFEALGFERVLVNGTRRVETALAIRLGDLTQDAPLVRIHSQCLTGEMFRSLRCDCAEQLDIAMCEIAAEQRGLVVYEHEEGRGIGLLAKLRAYELQDAGLDTVDANVALGFPADSRDFSLSAVIVRRLGIRRLRLLSNNPRKAHALAAAGLEVIERVPCETPANPHSFGYLRTKKERLGHLLTLEQQPQETPGVAEQGSAVSPHTPPSGAPVSMRFFKEPYGQRLAARRAEFTNTRSSLRANVRAGVKPQSPNEINHE